MGVMGHVRDEVSDGGPPKQQYSIWNTTTTHGNIDLEIKIYR